MDEINRRNTHEIHFIRHSLVDSQSEDEKCRDLFYDDRNHADRKFSTDFSYPDTGTSFEWPASTHRLYESRPELMREMNVRLYSHDVIRRCIAVGCRHVVELTTNSENQRNFKVPTYPYTNTRKSLHDDVWNLLVIHALPKKTYFM